MNINDYRRGMDKIVPDTALKERIMNQTKRTYTPARRVFTIALAAALSVTCLATAALAASPELRTAVLSFFRMEEREQVPSGSVSPDGPDLSQADIGELVKAQYIKMDSRRYGFQRPAHRPDLGRRLEDPPRRQILGAQGRGAGPGGGGHARQQG